MTVSKPPEDKDWVCPVLCDIPRVQNEWLKMTCQLGHNNKELGGRERRKGVSDRGNSMCKGYEEEENVKCSRNQEKLDHAMLNNLH